MTSQIRTNREIFTGFADLFFEQKKARLAFETFVREEYIQHNPALSDGRAAAIERLEGLFAGNPAMTFRICRILVDGDLAAIHCHLTNGPDDLGTAIIDIFRIEDGKIVEHWDVHQQVPAESANGNSMF